MFNSVGAYLASVVLARLPATMAVPTPGAGKPPPGAGKLLKLLDWVAWGAVLCCVGGVIVAAARMAIDHSRHGGGAEHAKGVGMALIATILTGAAATIVTVLL